jgi:hypothetical protein
MQFRWVAGITLWTFIAGPAFGPPIANSQPHQKSSDSVKEWKTHAPHPKNPGHVKPSCYRIQAEFEKEAAKTANGL